MDGITAKVLHLRDSFVPEILILLLLVVYVVTSYHGLVDATPWLGQGVGPDLQAPESSGFRLTVRCLKRLKS